MVTRNITLLWTLVSLIDQNFITGGKSVEFVVVKEVFAKDTVVYFSIFEIGLGNFLKVDKWFPKLVIFCFRLLNLIQSAHFIQKYKKILIKAQLGVYLESDWLHILLHADGLTLDSLSVKWYFCWLFASNNKSINIK